MVSSILYHVNFQLISYMQIPITIAPDIKPTTTYLQMIYQARNGISLGANESFLPQHQVSADTDLALGRLSTVLEWKSEEYRNYKKVTDYFCI